MRFALYFRLLKPEAIKIKTSVFPFSKHSVFNQFNAILTQFKEYLLTRNLVKTLVIHLSSLLGVNLTGFARKFAHILIEILFLI
jgi:hypothetical protein